MDEVLTASCSTCNGPREVRDWHEDREMLVIDLACGHTARRTARLEWLPATPGRAAARALSLAVPR